MSGVGTVGTLRADTPMIPWLLYTLPSLPHSLTHPQFPHTDIQSFVQYWKSLCTMVVDDKLVEVEEHKAIPSLL